MYDRIPYQVKPRAGNRGITAEDMEKSQHTDFSEGMTNESTPISLACSNIRLWKLDSQKERTFLDAFEMKGPKKILQVSWKQRKQMHEFLKLE